MLLVSAERRRTGLEHRALAASPQGASAPASLTAHTWASVTGLVSQCSEEGPVEGGMWAAESVLVVSPASASLSRTERRRRASH